MQKGGSKRQIFKPQHQARPGLETAMNPEPVFERPELKAQPVEIAPSYLFLACEDSSYISGQFLHPNGGEIING